jgi:hypothetical protein
MPVVVASLIAACVGCDVVTLDKPIGEPLSQAEKTEFVGRWINDDSEVFDIRLTPAGTLLVGTLSWDGEKQQHHAESLAIDARKVGEAIYFLVSTDEGDILFTRIERTGKNEFTRRDPDARAFREAVEARQLDGRISTGKNRDYVVQIPADSRLTENALSSKELPALFEKKENQQLFRRIKAFDESE